MRLLLAWWAALALGLLFQSTLLPNLLTPAWRPDFTRALVLWVALTGVPRGGPYLAFAAGFGVDAVSGAPPGFTAFLRLLVYGMARPFRGVLVEDRPLLLVPFAALAAVLDALGAGVLSWTLQSAPIGVEVLFSVGWRQAFADAFWVPAVFVLLELVSGRHSQRQVTA